MDSVAPHQQQQRQVQQLWSSAGTLSANDIEDVNNYGTSRLRGAMAMALWMAPW